MTAQFNAMYGQLLCCNCPGGLLGIHCSNKTATTLAHPLLTVSIYAWIAGLICFLFLSMVSIVLVIYCWKRQRNSHEDDIASILNFTHSSTDEENVQELTEALVPPSFENPGYQPVYTEDNSKGGVPKILSFNSLYYNESESKETGTRLEMEDSEEEIST